MINKPLDKIERIDIESLVANGVAEGRALDYKQQLPAGSDADKLEFLADVSSFANASGGDILYGVVEKRDPNGQATGVPDLAVGLAGINVDAEIRRLDNMIRDGIDPRIMAVQIQAIDGFRDGPIIVVRIPKSWASPHMVKRSSRFYSRDNRGKYQLDVREIRAAFAVSESLPDKVRRFRDERLARIVADETPVALENHPRIVLHILPIAALDPTVRIDVAGLTPRAVRLPPIFYLSSSGHRFNFDGFLNYSKFPNSPYAHSYLQIFRNGALEAVEASLLREKDGRRLIPSVAYEEKLIDALGQYLGFIKDLSLQPPVFVMLALLRVKEYEMEVNMKYFSGERHPIDRDVLVLPEAVVESFTEKPASILRPAFDAVWQAAGWRQSLNYDREGNWCPQ